MNITVNGENRDIPKELTVAELLEECDVKMPDMVSVELNGDILRRGTYAEQTVGEGDKVEFLYFMGGGEQWV